jgi:hypothetical protein
MRFWVILASIVFGCSLLADNNATIEEVTDGKYLTTEGRLDEYLEISVRDPGKLATMVSGDLLASTPTPGQPAFAWNFARNYYSVVFAATRPGESDREIVRFLLHDTGKRVEVVDHLPGITDFFEVFLANDPDASVATVFSTEPLPNPLEEKALKLVKLIEEPLAGFVPAVLPAAPAAPVAPLTDEDIRKALEQDAKTPPVFVVLRSVRLVDARSTVSVSTAVADSSDFDRLGLLGQLARTDRSLRQTVTIASPCARTLSSNIFDQMTNLLLHPPAQPPSLIVSPAERRLIVASVKDETSNPKGAIPRTLLTAPCPTELAGVDAAPKATAFATVQERLVGVLASNPDNVTGSHKFSDTPLQHFDLGAAGGAIVSRSGAVRAKLDDGVLVADQVSGLLSMAVLHWHPVAFDPETARPTSAERGSVLVGFVVQPEPGLAAGVSWSLFRGLSVHVSHAWMLVDQLKKDLDFGPKPAEIDDPFRRGWTRAWTVGFGYNFE